MKLVSEMRRRQRRTRSRCSPPILGLHARLTRPNEALYVCVCERERAVMLQGDAAVYTRRIALYLSLLAET